MKLKTLNVERMEKMATHYMTQKWPVPKWLQFSAFMLRNGFEVKYYAAKSTVSKYVYVSKGDKTYKVRFSNHPPAAHREVANDCDYFVGVTNFTITNTQMAVKAALEFFNEA